MSNTKNVTEAIVTQGILPLYFHQDVKVSIAVLRALYSAGIRVVEYTSRGDAALNNFKEMIAARNFEMKDMLLGIGTIKNLQSAKDYLQLGADFLVSPGLVNDVAIYAVNNDVFYAPGCMTPTEIIAAEGAGIKFIKLFPGNILGTEFLISIKDVFPNLLFMPTGGVDITQESIEKWFHAGVCAVGMGSKLITKNRLEQKDYSSIEKETAKVLKLILSIRK